MVERCAWASEQVAQVLPVQLHRGQRDEVGAPRAGSRCHTRKELGRCERYQAPVGAPCWVALCAQSARRCEKLCNAIIATSTHIALVLVREVHAPLARQAP